MANVASLQPLSSVEKYTMPESEYEKLPGTVLAQKKAQQIGRFNPKAPQVREMKVKEMMEEVERRSKSYLFASWLLSCSFRLLCVLLADTSPMQRRCSRSSLQTRR